MPPREVPARSGGKPLAITGLGMATALGPDVVTSCAAARAGISRAAASDDYPLWDPEECALVPAIVSHIPWLTRGFAGLGRLVRLGEAACQDLVRGLDPALRGRLGLILNLGSSFHFLQSLTAPPGEPPAPANFAAKVTGEIDDRRQLIVSHLVRRLRTLEELKIDPRNVHLLFGDEAGFVTALDLAQQMLDAGQVQGCIVGGLDSQVERETLEALRTLATLKSPEQPTGRIPGEAAALVLVERASEARRRKAEVQGVIDGWWSAREATHRFSDQPATGQALFQCMSQLLRSAADGPVPQLVIGDLTGETFRAVDWGTALVRLRSNNLPSTFREWYPAASFGTMGAAAGPVAAGMACRGLRRHYAGGDAVASWLASDDGARGAMLIRRE